MIKIRMMLRIEVTTDDDVTPVVIEVPDESQSFGVRQVTLHDGLRIGNQYQMDSYLLGKALFAGEREFRNILEYTMGQMLHGVQAKAAEGVHEHWGNND